MKTHIILALLALVITACASKENINPNSQAEIEKEQTREEFAKNKFEAGSRNR